MSAAVRVYLFTYRRNALLPRAIDSLLAQTHTNWICELHNDDPDDHVPEQMVRKIGDPRIVYLRHERNLGPTAAFNLAFRRVEEPFISILEDDNWWQPQLLERLQLALNAHPQVSLAWANMWLWQEGEGDRWDNVGTVWPTSAAAATEVFDRPHPRQVCGSLHSNGAMLVRSSAAAQLVVPSFVPFFAMESFRDRLIQLPIVLVNEPLANFAMTRDSARRETADDNLQVLTLLAATAFDRPARSAEFLRSVWAQYRGHRGHTQRALIAAGAITGRLASVLRSATPADLAVVIGWILRHPRRFAGMLAARQRFPELHAFLTHANQRDPASA